MIGLFGTLDLASNSLSVQEEAMEVTGQNLANVNTTGYTRQQLEVQAATPLQTPIGQEGTGVEATGISQATDALLNSQIQAENSVTGSLTAQQTALQNTETSLNEQISNTSTGTASPSGITADLANLFGSFQSLSTDPSNLTDRQSLVANAQQLATEFNQVSSSLGSVNTQLNQSIQNDVTSSNQDLTQIASLNQQIIEAQGDGGSANDLEDEREQAIENLSNYVNVTATAQSNGGVNIGIGGVTMVSGGTATDSLETYDAGGGQLQIQAQNAGTHLTLSSGSIEGDITVRDGALATLQTSVNTLASQLITQVNGIYSSGYDLNGNTGADFFTGTDASNIGVNSALANDPGAVQASGTAGATGDNSVALKLAQLANTNIPGLSNQTFSQSWAQTVGDLGYTVSEVNQQVTNSASANQMLSNQRQSVSGVSIDQEMTNLMQYEKSYEASAQIVTSLNQMLQTIVDMDDT
ncbi:MAG TPA: flagellar hook-associated protein FlgK [Candidatus Baltobacteraceae bacterium]|jgi:flagellar hook-associated protein 1 FlgK|nr:flagellar hook-associated protein FlgK [Candidatus Baltobacteraceae bacterium]